MSVAPETTCPAGGWWLADSCDCLLTGSGCPVGGGVPRLFPGEPCVVRCAAEASDRYLGGGGAGRASMCVRVCLAVFLGLSVLV